MIQLIRAFFLFFLFITPTFGNLSNENKKTEKKNLVLITSPDYPPFEFIKNGEIEGLEIDIIKEIGKRNNWNLKIDKTDFNSIIGALIHKKADISVSGFNPTPERKKSIDFSDVYKIDSPIGIITKTGVNITNLSDLKGKTVATQTATIAADILRKTNQKENLGIKILNIQSNSIAIQMLKSQKIDGIFIDKIVGNAFLNNLNDDNFKFYKTNENYADFAIAIPKNSIYKNEINKTFEEMKKDGTYDKIIKKWLKNESTGVKNDDFYKDLIKISFGAFLTIKVCIIAAIFGYIIGFLIAIFNFNKKKSIFSYVLKGYVSVVRGTPVLLQLSFWFFCLPIFTGYNITTLEAGILTLIVNSSAYISEIIRGGLKSFDKGQIDAAISLNITKFKMYKDIIIPQVFKNVTPMLINEFIALIKESAVLSIIGIQELTFKGNLFIGQYYNYFWPIFVVGLTYYILCKSIEIFGQYIEKKLEYDKI